MKKIFLLIPIVFLLTARPVFSQATSQQICDLCGSCVGQPLPQDYDQCKECNDKKDHTWSIFGCIPTTEQGFVQAILRIFTSIVGGLSFLSLLYGGGVILASRGNPEQLNTGKSIVVSSIGGLLLVVMAIFILQLIGGGFFDLPGFGS